MSEYFDMPATIDIVRSLVKDDVEASSPPDIFRIKPEFWNRCEGESGVE
jgi:hypothetical protein